MAYKRKYSSISTAARSGRMGRKYVSRKFGRKTARMVYGDQSLRASASAIRNRVSRIERTIETKESTQVTTTNLPLAHNALNVIMNPIITNQGTGDAMSGTGTRIGDQVTVRGLKIKFFLQNQASRPKVWYRIFLIRSANGDIIDRSTFFKGLVGNKMIDQVNTERFSILAQKTICLTTSPAQTVQSFNVPSGAPETGNAGTVAGGIATKVVQMWIPGLKFGRGGVIKFRDGSTNTLKFFDYRIAIVAYDLYGTPQDVNNVGAVSEGYCKLYFKDA